MKTNRKILAEVLKVPINSIENYESYFLRIDEALEAMSELRKVIESERQTSNKVSDNHETKALSTADVSNQRKLLLDFCNKKLRYNGVKMLDNEFELVDEYLKSNNCC